MSLVDLNSATWTLELPNLFEGGLGLTPFTRGHRTTYLPEKVEVKLVLIRNSAQFTRVMWVHTWVLIRIAFSAILLLTSASGQTVAKRVRSPSQPKIGAVKKLLDAARKMPGAIDEAIEGISNHDMQSMIDGSNKIIKRFKQGQRWFNELRQRLAEDKYPDVVPNSTEAERLRSEIFECFPITQERCFTPCGLSSNRKYRFCYLDSKNSSLPRDRGLQEGAAARGQGPVDALPRVPSTRRARGSEEDHQ